MTITDMLVYIQCIPEHEPSKNSRNNFWCILYFVCLIFYFLILSSFLCIQITCGFQRQSPVHYKGEASQVRGESCIVTVYKDKYLKFSWKLCWESEVVAGDFSLRCMTSQSPAACSFCLLFPDPFSSEKQCSFPALVHCFTCSCFCFCPTQRYIYQRSLC